MTNAEFQRVKKGSRLEDTSGIYEVSQISPDRLISVKEIIFCGDSCDDFIYGSTSYVTHREVRQMELIAD